MPPTPLFPRFRMKRRVFRMRRVIVLGGVGLVAFAVLFANSPTAKGYSISNTNEVVSTTGGGGYKRADCPTGSVVYQVGATGISSGTALTRPNMQCADLTLNGATHSSVTGTVGDSTWGGSGDTALTSQRCTSAQAVVGAVMHKQSNGWVSGFQLMCGSIPRGDGRSTSGTVFGWSNPGTSSPSQRETVECPTGMVAVGMVAYTGAVMDRLGFRCGTISGADQATVTVTSASSITFGSTLALSATGGTTTGAFTFAATGNCTVSGTTLTATGNAGATCSVTATRPGDTNYDAWTSAAQTVTIQRAANTISFTDPVDRVWSATPFNVVASATSNVAPTITSNTPSVCSTSGLTVTMLSSGTCSLTASQAISTNYTAAADVSQSFVISATGRSGFVGNSSTLTGTTTGTEYVVERFTTTGSSTWTVPQGVTAFEYLVVGGGGAGGTAFTHASSGGGGGGQVVTGSVTSGIASSYTITVGAGGTATTTFPNPGGDGGSSTLAITSGATLTTARGGGGGSSYTSTQTSSASTTGFTGGGGGTWAGSWSSGSTGTGGAGVKGGDARPDSSDANLQTGGGGGGAGGVGGAGTSTTGGTGGVGISSAITGSTITYGGGGGGGKRMTISGSGGTGTHGGGNGGMGVAGSDGVTNRGGGGGGAGNNDTGNRTGGAGGSGIVVVRYVLPTVSTPDLAAASDNGSSSTDNITSNATLTFTGSAPVGANVQLLIATASSSSDTDATTGTWTNTGSACTANSTTGAWSCTTASLTSGLYKVRSTATTALDGLTDTTTSTTALVVSVDNTAPSVSLSRLGSGGLRSGQTETVTVTLSEASADFVVGDITVSGGTLSSFTAVSSSVYTVVFTPTANTNAGSASLSVGAGVFTDLATNTNTASTALTFSYDTLRPTVSLSGCTLSYAANATCSITITLSDNVTDLAAEDFSVTRGTLSSLTSTGTTRTVTFTASGTFGGIGEVSVVANGLSDAAGNTNVASNTLSITIAGSNVRQMISSLTASGVSVASNTSGASRYIVHTFAATGSATWTAPQGVSRVDVLVVGGGGGAGSRGAGGAGAGGYIEASNYTVTPGSSYSVVVGAGGAGAVPATNDSGAAGSASSFTLSSVGLTANGGGAGLSHSSNGNGGASGTSSGAGGTAFNTAGGNGRANGTCGSTADWCGGGGGGATTAGVNAVNSGGNGGNGRASSITGTSITFAGGGGGGGGDSSDPSNSPSPGGTGGTGGGGNGGSPTWDGTNCRAAAGGNGVPNTGGGGGGGAYCSGTQVVGNYNGGGGTGGSGIVVLRYALPAPSTPDLATGSDSGSSSVDNITRNQTLTFTGTAAVTASVQLSVATASSTSDTDATTGTWTDTGAACTADSTSGSWTCTTASLSPGLYKVRSIATTTLDGTTDTQTTATALVVNVDTTAPTVSSVAFTSNAGADNAYKAGDIVQVTVTMSEAVVVTGTPRIPLSGLTSKFATLSSGGGTSSLVFTYTIVSGDNDADGLAMAADALALNGGTIADGSGNNATITHSAVATASAHTVDTTVPTITITRSGSGTVTAGQTSTITFTLSESATDFVAGDITTTGGTLSALSGSGTTYTATYTPTVESSGTATFTVAIGAFTDPVGNSNTASGSLNVAYDTGILLARYDASKSSSYSGSGATTWTDLTGNGRHAALVGSPAPVAATSSAARSISLPALSYGTLHNRDFSNFSGGITIQSTLNFGAAGSFERVIDFGRDSNGGVLVWGDAAPNDNVVWARDSTTNDLLFSMRNGATEVARCSAAGAILNNTVANYAVTLSFGGSCQMYRNGAAITTTTTTTYTTRQDIVTRNSNYIGRSNWNTNADLEGSIRSLYIYNRAISASEVLNNYDTERQFTITYDANNATSGTAPSSTTYTTTSFTAAGTAATVAANTGTLARTGLGFGGWNTAADGSGTNYPAGSGTYQVANDITLYAQWNDITAPTPTLTTASIRNTQTATGQSTETGTLYLVNSSVSVTNLASITGAANNLWNSASVTAVNTDTTISAAGLADGTYRLYAIDASNNLSTASTDSVIVDTTAPTVTISANPASVTSGSSTTVTFTISESTTTLTSADVSATLGSLTGFSGSGASYTATFTSSRSSGGTAVITVASGSFTDAVGNATTSAFTLNIAVANTSSSSGGRTTYVGDGTNGTNGVRYFVERFTTTGASSWTVPNGVTTADVLLIGGGGGAGDNSGGGGSGGGFSSNTNVAVSGTINLSVGAGGLAGTSNTDHGRNGSASTFGALSVNGGNGGRSFSGTGGASVSSSGAGGNGSTSSSVAGGAGGAGATSRITGSLVTYSGGGGGGGWITSTAGGAGGAGGGGAGGGLSGVNGVNGVAGTNGLGGGGGSGSNGGSTAGDGGSGIVIVRYAVPATSTPDLDAADDTSTNTDNVTTATTLTFTGSAPVGSTIQLLVDGVESGSTCTADDITGAWTCDTSTLTAGSKVITARSSTVFNDSTITTTSSGLTVTIDAAAPTISSVSFTSTSGADNTYKIGDIVNVTVAFSENVVVTGVPGIALAGLTNKSATYSSGSGTSSLVFAYTVVAGDNDTDGLAISANSMELNSGAIKDTAGIDATLTHSAVATQSAQRVDGDVPTVTITRAGSTSLRSGQTDTITFTLSETSTNFISTDVTVSGGTVSGFTGSGTSYTATFTPTAATQSGTGSISIAGGVFTDAASNSNTASSTLSITYDTLVPTVSIARAGSGSLRSGQTDTITFTLSEASSDFAVGDITVTGGTIGTLTTTSSTVYSVVFTPTTNTNSGTGAISVAGARFTDANGNDNTASSTLSINYDTQAPTVDITRSGSGSLRSGQTSTITFTLSEASSSFAGGDITVTGGTIGTLTTTSSTVYSVVFTPTTNTNAGTGSISVAGSTFTDTVGNDNSASSTLNIDYDTLVPTVTVTRAGSGSLKSGDTETITFTLSESSANFISTDVSVSGGSISIFSGSGTSYTATFTPTTNTNSGTGSISVGGSTFTDTVGNNNSASTALSISYDTGAPTVSISASPSSVSSGSTTTVTFTVNETTTTFTSSDVSARLGTLTGFSGSGTSYTATFTGSRSTGGTAVITVASGSLSDSSGNSNTTSFTLNINVTNTSSSSGGRTSYIGNGTNGTNGVRYFVERFTTTGSTSWSVPRGVTQVDTLIIAGGGGGGGGGGGAGGVVSSTSSPVTPGANISITVGAGGNGGTNPGSGIGSGGDGGNSSFGVTTAFGGGGGGGRQTAGRAGGSSGGSGQDSNADSGAASQGFKGGAGFAAVGCTSAAGGGGAGGVGSMGFTQCSPQTPWGGNGGIGTSSSITGSLAYYAGGGGGGSNNNSTPTATRGWGGGAQNNIYGAGDGANGDLVNGGNALSNTGSGGGGADWEATNGGTGGSGIVIVRYAVPSISTPDLDSADDTGINTDNITSATTLTLTGPAPVGATVQLFVDGVASGNTCIANANTGVWTCDTATLTAGDKVITAESTTFLPDSTVVATSSSLTVTIDTTAPTISSMSFTSSSGSDNTYKIGDTVTIAVAFSENVTVTNTPRIALAGLTSKFATYTSGSGTSTLVFSYTIVAGDTDADGLAITADSLGLNSGTIADTAANNATLTHSAVTTQSAHQVDGIAPTVTISRAGSGSLKSGDTDTITFTLSEASSDFAVGDITVTGGTIGTLTTTSSTVYSVVFTPTANTNSGTGSISVAGARFTDANGNDNTASSTLSINYDTLAPTVTITRAGSGSLRAGQTDTITFTLSEASSNFAVGDITVTGGTIGTLTTTSSTVYSVVLTPTTNTNSGTGSISVSGSTFTDTVGNDNTASSTLSINYDTLAPTVTITRAGSGSLKSGDTETITFTLSESSANFISTDISVSGGSISSFSGSGTSYTATFTPTANSNSGSGSISVSGSTFTDAIGNNNSASSTMAINYDTGAPTVSLSASPSTVSSGSTTTVTFTVSESTTNFTSSDVSATLGTLTGFSGSGTSYTATFSGSRSTGGIAVITVASGSFSDSSGNTNTTSFTLNITVTNTSSSSGGRTSYLANGTNGTNGVRYFVERFTTVGSSSWTAPRGVTSVEYLVIGGGGGGAGGHGTAHGGGGGGAGGYRTNASGQTSGGGAATESAFAVTPGTSYTVVVGAGGTSGAVRNIGGTGGNSQFGTITAAGGGGGGSFYVGPTQGGSGGGAGASNNFITGANGTTSQGFKGGNTPTVDFTTNGAGGGGSGGVGQNGVDAGPMAVGGVGTSSSITGTSETRAAGGSGGVGNSSAAGATATSNTGNGGGGGSATGNVEGVGGAGGSGLVVVRYAVPAVTAPDLDSADDTGINTDNITSATTLTLTGSAPVGATIQLFVDGVASGNTCVADSVTGIWSCDTAVLTAGDKVITAESTAILADSTVVATSSGLTVTVDTTAPTISSVSFTSNSGSDNTYKNGDVVTVAVSFSENVTVTNTPRIALAGLTNSFATYTSGSGTSTLVFSYTVGYNDNDIDGLAISANSLSLNSGTIADTAANNATLTHGAVATQSAHRVDGTPSNVYIGRVGSGVLKIGQTDTLTFRLEEASSNFEIGDISVTGGTLSSFTSTSSTEYTALFTPTPNTHATTATFRVAGSSFTDAAGNGNNPSTDYSIVYDTKRPTVAITRAHSWNITAGTNPIFIFTLSEDATNFTSADITVAGGTFRDFEAVSATVYQATFTPTANVQSGVLQISVASGAFTDWFGNGNEASSLSTNYDTLRPTVAITRAGSGTLKAGQTETLTFTLSEPATDFALNDINVQTGGTISSFTATSSTVYTAIVTPTANTQAGTVGLTIDGHGTSLFTDAAGNGNNGASLSISFDTRVPTISSVTSSTANGTMGIGSTVSIQVQFSESVTVSGTPLITLETGTTDRTASYTSGSGTNTLTFEYTVQSGDTASDLDYASTNALALNGGTIADAAGNNATLTLPTPGASGSLAANKAIVVASAPTQIISVRTPTSAASGAAFSPQPQVSLQDTGGSVVTSDNTTVVTATVSTGASLVGTRTATASNGIVTFSNLGITGTAGTQYIITYSATVSGNALTVATQTVTPSVGAATQIAVTTQPVGDTAGALLSTFPRVSVLDSGSNVVTTATTSITVSSSGGTLGGTSIVSAVNGVATFGDLTFAGTASTNYTLSFTTTSLGSATSNNFSVGVGAATKLAITTPASGAAYNETFTAQPVVEIRDAGNNKVTTATDVVTATLSSGTVVGSNNATLTATATNGTATFNGLGITGLPGSYTITYSSGVLTDTNQSISVVKANQTISFTAPTDRQWSASSFAVTPTASSGLNVSLASTTTNICTVAGFDITMVTVGTCSITATQTGNDYFNAANAVSRSFTISQASQTITFATPADRPWSASTFTLAPSASSGLTVSLASTTTGVCTVSTFTVTMLKAGTCTLSATQAGNTIYLAANAVSRSFEINLAAQAALNITSTTATYGATLTLTTTGGSGSGSVSFTKVSGDCSVNGTALTPTAAGSCVVTATKAADTQYDSTSDTQTVTINRANQATLNISSTTGTYGTSLVLTTSGGTTNGVVTWGVSNGTASNCQVVAGELTTTSIGTCTVTASMAGDTNYNSVANNGTTVTINAKPITVTAEAKQKTYGDNDPALTFTTAVGALVGNDTLAGSLTRVAGENVGTYTINRGTVANSNYNITYVSALLTIDTKAITVTAEAKQKTYGDNDPALTFTTAVGALVGNDTLAGSLTRVAGENVGTYTINRGTVANSNYNITYVSALLTIDTKPITVTAVAKTKVFGDTDPSLTYTTAVGALVGNDTLAGSLTRVAGENVGTYTINRGTVANTNYSITFITNNLSITQAQQSTLSVTTSNITYRTPVVLQANGGTEGDLSFSIVSAGTAGCSLENDTLSATGDAGSTCTVTATRAATSNYFQKTSSIATITVVPRAITITANAQEKTYGDTDPGFSFVVTSGAIYGSDTFTGALGRVAGENVGTYNMTRGTLANNNYNITFVSAQLTISQRLITVTAGNKTKIFGQSDPTLTYTVTSGNLAGSDSLSGSITRAAGETLGTYNITRGTLNNNNYNITFINGTLQIFGAPQSGFTLTASSYSVTYQQTVTLQTTGGNGAGAISYNTQSGTGACSVSGNTVTGDLAGTCSVTAVKAAEGGYLEASSNTITITVDKANQSITVAQMPDHDFSPNPMTVSATSSSGHQVVMTSRTPNVCAMENFGLVMKFSGTCTVEADIPESRNHNAATTVVRSFAIRAVVPFAPAITAVDPGDTTVSIAFSTGLHGGSSITAYQYSVDDGARWTSLPNGTITSPLVIGNLPNNVEAKVRIKAINSVGVGAASNMRAATPVPKRAPIWEAQRKVETETQSSTDTAGAPMANQLPPRPAVVRTLGIQGGRRTQVIATRAARDVNIPVTHAVITVRLKNGRLLTRIQVRVDPTNPTTTVTVPFQSSRVNVSVQFANQIGLSPGGSSGTNIAEGNTLEWTTVGGTASMVGSEVPGPVLFAPGSSQLTYTAQQTLKKMAATIQRRGGLVYVTGFSRPGERRSAWTLEPLARARAEAVAKYLSRQGVRQWITFNGTTTTASRGWSTITDPRVVVTTVYPNS